MSNSVLVTVPPEWAKLGIGAGYSPIDFDRLRWFIAGVPRVGKTTFVSTNPHAIIIDADGKAPAVQSARCARFPLDPVAAPLDPESYMRIHNWLLDQATKLGPANPIHTVCYDSWDEFRNRVSLPLLTDQYFKRGWVKDKDFETCLDYGGRPGDRGGTGAGYTQLAKLEMVLLGQLSKAGYGYVIMSHLTRESAKLGDSVEKKASASLVVTTPESSMKQVRPKVHIYARMTHGTAVVNGKIVECPVLTFKNVKAEEVDVGCNVSLPQTFAVTDPTRGWDLVRAEYVRLNPPVTPAVS